MSKTEYKSRVYTDRPDYADFDAPAKFQAIHGIIARRLREHPKSIAAYSGGSDSDLIIHMLENARKVFKLPHIEYCFYNTGLEMQAIKNHVKETAQKYSVDIKMVDPYMNIVTATKKYGIPFISKMISEGIGRAQTQNVPFAIGEEYDNALNKQQKFAELLRKYPKWTVRFICGCDKDGNPQKGQGYLNSVPYLRDFLIENPPDFIISNKCCEYCKKRTAHLIQKDYELVITGERKAEGGARAMGGSCFDEQSNGQYRLKPLYYVSDTDKKWYKEYYNINYSDAYEVYGLARTGCCGCSIASKAVEDLEKIRPFEPNVVKAAWNIFGASYRYRQKYNEYKRKRMDEEKKARKKVGGQLDLFGEAEP